MKKWSLLLLVSLCIVGSFLILFGTQPSNARTIHVSTEVNRIVSLAPNLTEILFALGLEDQIVGVPIRSNFPPAVAGKPKIGTFWQPNIEAVIATKPDLVITLDFPQQKDLAQRLRRIGYNTLVLRIEKVNDLFCAIERIGQVTGKDIQAEELKTEIKTKLDILSKLVLGKDKVKVLWVVQKEPLRIAGTETFVNEIIELAGGQNAIGPTIHKYPPIGSELVYACGADVIIEPAMLTENLAKEQRSAHEYWSRFENVPAVRNQRIYVIDGDIISQLGPRLYEGVEKIAGFLRPEIFEK